ncbi:multidrug ABC transporter permease [Halogeometricum borinquense DSM 11551]|uniref:ABC-type multidrug transport system, permease component n=2 Tax=Halogeometricum borinquense TaxID=60847 RepID=E4NKS2_HALBP|nr:ABC transporter permease [Halogeometricum borinquense]ADQ65968.1 ABC-type multidrug transport system, permease component [Halogeometricum borinquense DSM 11551]ELY23124.1 multidrug ABC transporter permease [Halogeometricum borinquense DSM 11551]RYJ19614.1 ABC transporter permease [Halogeometricum borinquense]
MSRFTDDADTSEIGTAQRASGNRFVVDIRVSLKRWLIKTSRNPFVTFSSLVQPIIFFVLMAEVFGSIAGGTLSQTLGDEINYVTYLTPAIVIQSALAAAAVSGIGLVDDIETGMFEKILVSPMNRGAMFLGKVLSEVVRIAIQTAIILALGYAMLFLQSAASVETYLQTGAIGAIGIVGIAVIFGGVFMAYSNIVALVTRDREATIMIANLLTFPLLFVSSAFLPLSVLPGWIRTFAVFNPITYGVDAIRALMLGQDTLSVLHVTVFSGFWNTVIPSLIVLLGANAALGGIAVRLLTRASRADVQ